MDHRTHPFACGTEQDLHMALSLIREEGLVRIFRSLRHQPDDSGLVELVNAHLDRGNPLRKIFGSRGPVERRNADNFCILSFLWVAPRRGWLTFGTQGEGGYYTDWAIDFNANGEVRGTELHIIYRDGEDPEFVA